jgi:L-lactate utilization protein LutC
MNRDDFLARVREAAAAGRTFTLRHHDDLAQRVGYAGAGSDLVARLAAEIEGAGGAARIVSSAAAARDVLWQILDDIRPRRALCWQHETLDRLGVANLLQSRQVEILNHALLAALTPDVRREAMLTADVGISGVEWAVAETGSLAVVARPGRERLTSLLPPVHVAVVEPAQILPDLFDLFDRLDPAGSGHMPGNVTLITGPSKTGDLELTLTTGVHGPGKLEVILVSAPGEGEQ